MLCRFVLLLRWHIRCLSTVAFVAVLCRHVAAVIRVGLLRFGGRRACCRRPSALSSLTPTSGRLPALGHFGQLREISVFAVENFAIHVDWPVVMQSVAVRVSAQSESQPFGARVLVSQVFESLAYDGIVMFAKRVSVAATRLRTENRTVFERERVGQRCSVTSDTEIVVPKGQEVSWYAVT